MAAGPPAPPPQIVVPGAGWVDVASRAIVQVGFPVVVAGILLWFLLTRFQDNMAAITTRMSANTEVAGEFVEQERLAFEELKKQSGDLAQQTMLMRQIAADAAKLAEVRTQELELMRQILRERTGSSGARHPPTD